ncbi:MAG TPA: hypothetical protein VFV38_11070 [Ktedonobacteraceae bacterium]|nr:hypothetical protein [Ktedonobacteraceae bacterium]
MQGNPCRGLGISQTLFLPRHLKKQSFSALAVAPCPREKRELERVVRLRNALQPR